MLILTRRVGESLRIGDDITVTVVQMGPGKVRIGVAAPAGCLILREELIGRDVAPPAVVAADPVAAMMPSAAVE